MTCLALNSVLNKFKLFAIFWKDESQNATIIIIKVFTHEMRFRGIHLSGY